MKVARFPWTPEQVAIFEDGYLDRKTDAEIADMIGHGCTACVVYNHRTRRGLPAVGMVRTTNNPQLVADIDTCYKINPSPVKIAAALNVSVRAVRKILTEQLGYTLQNDRYVAAGNSSASPIRHDRRLDAEQKQIFRKAWKTCTSLHGVRKYMRDHGMPYSTTTLETIAIEMGYLDEKPLGTPEL